MRILFTLNSLRKGGIEKATLDTARALSDNGHTVTILTFNNTRDQATTDNDHIVCVHSESRCTIDNYIKKLNSEYSFDLIIHTRHSIRTPWFPNTFYIIHNVLSERLPPRKKYIKRWLKIRQHHNQLDHQNLICVSNAVKEDIKKMGLNPTSNVVIPNIYDIDRILRLSAEFIPDISYNYAISVGSFNPVKRHDILLKAFAMQNALKNLVIIGSGGSAEAEVKSLVHDLSITDRVVFLGYKQNPYPYIKNANITIISSDSESFSSVTIESLILGTPVISTDCLGPVEIMGKAFEEFIAKRGDAKNLRDKILLALEEYPNIEDSIYQKYSPKNIIDSYSKLIK